jgi:thioredoxin reductase (NADPH)
VQRYQGARSGHEPEHFKLFAKLFRVLDLVKISKISVVWNNVVKEFVGAESPPALTGLRLRNIRSSAVTGIKAAGAFIAIGHRCEPEGWLFLPPEAE